MKRILPPILFLFCIISIATLKYFFSYQKIIFYPYNLVGVVFSVLGLFIIGSVIKLFRQKKTEIHTFKKPKKLLTESLFKYSRNPIYLGFVIALIGVSLIIGNFLSIIPIIFFVVVANFWYIPFEEKKLSTEFGIEYEKYKKQVRRWI